ncbi:DUF4270 family protein [Leadbetterella sp. DM7]|uniref:DUF4270 family protein n=1 Tax=Leadbetterella sp. DM7 TaxID=3235085 RepID=UPI00349EEA17
MKNRFCGFGKLIALALSVSLFACHDPSEIGMGLGTDGTLNAIYTDTVSVAYSTVLSDSAVNGNAVYLLAGNITDPVFGPVEAVAYFQPSLLPQFNSSGTILTGSDGTILYDTLSVSATAVPDSMNFRLYFDGSRIFGDTNAICKFRVHRLTSIMKTTPYNGDEKLAYDPQPLAEFEFNLPKMRNDSTGALIARFVSLPKSVAQEMINEAVAAKGNNATFISKFKGFAIVPDKNNKAVYGFATGVLDLSGYNSSVIPYWHAEGDTTSQYYVFNINGPRFTSMTFDRSKTALSSLSKTRNELPLTSAADRLYVQSGSGIGTKIDLSALRYLGKDMKVARAVLEFQLDPSTINTLYGKSYYVTLAEADNRNQQRRNSANQLTYLYNGTADNVMGSYFAFSDTSAYINIEITNYLQKQLFKGDLNKQLLLLPAAVNSTSGMAILSNDNLARLVFLKPRLLLYYNRYN